MSNKKKSAAELRAENRLLRKYRTTEGVVAVIKSTVKWAGVVLLGRYGYLSIVALSGHATMANIGLKFLGDMRVNDALAWLLGGTGIVYGGWQGKLRRDTVERLHGRIKKFEEGVDPERSSSRLTARGKTRPEDRP